MLSPSVITFFSVLATFFIVMGVTRPEGSIFAATSSDSLFDSLDKKLKTAGVTSITPPVLLVGGTIAAGLVLLVTLFATGQPIIAVICAALTPLAISLELDRRARKFQDKLTSRMVPLLRKVTSQVRAGENPAKAFTVATTEDPLVAWVLREPLKDLELQRPFNDVLDDTLPLIPIRPWAQFIRSMQAFSESGGELAETLAANVSRINSQILLRQRLMGDVAQYRGQQVIIIGFAIAIPSLLMITGGNTFGSIFDSFGGIVMFLVAVGLDIFALWMTNRAVRDVERRLEA
jgi:Flp pilus assembly protein TadB